MRRLASLRASYLRSPWSVLGKALPSLALLLTAVPASAAEWYAGDGVQLDLQRADAGTKVRDYVRGRGLELSLYDTELEPMRIAQSKLGTKAVHLRQYLDGVPVLGGGVVVRVNADGSVQRVVVDVARDLSVDTVPSLSQAEAEAALTQTLERALPAAERAELVIGRFDGGTLLWALDVRDSLGGTRYFVDAHDGRLLMTRELALDVLGRVYPQNRIETPLEDRELALLTVADPQRLNGWDGLLTVTNFVSGNSQEGFVVDQTLGPNVGADFLYDPPAMMSDATDGLAQVNLYYHLTSVRTLFQDLGADVNGASWKLTAVANAKDDNAPLDNAFFSQMGIEGDFASPNLIAIGQGTQNDFAYDSDVFKHEFGHYVTFNAIDYNMGQAFFDELGLSPFSGAIDEGIADYFACSDNDDAELGEASLGPIGGLRDLTNTSAKCPDDMVGEVHADGEIIGSLSWSIREEFGKQIGDELIWGALLTLNAGANFDDFAKGILDTAAELVTAGTLQQADIATIEGILAERGLDDCGRIVTLAPGQSVRGTIIGLDIVGLLVGASCEDVVGFGVEIPSLFHYSWTPGPNDKGVKLSITLEPDGPGAIDYSIVARKNQPVGFSGGGFLPTATAFDHDASSFSETGELIIDENSDPPFDPSATYDFVIASRNCPLTSTVVSAEAYEAPPVPEGGGGAGGSSNEDGGAGGAGGEGGGADDLDDDDDDGCGCALPGSSSTTGAGGALAAALALGALARRRRAKPRH